MTRLPRARGPNRHHPRHAFLSSLLIMIYPSPWFAKPTQENSAGAGTKPNILLATKSVTRCLKLETQTNQTHERTFFTGQQRRDPGRAQSVPFFALLIAKRQRQISELEKKLGESGERSARLFACSLSRLRSGNAFWSPRRFSFGCFFFVQISAQMRGSCGGGLSASH